jgi:hypothetical protein
MKVAPYLLSAIAGALLASTVEAEYAPYVVGGFFIASIALSSFVIAENNGLIKGPGALLGKFDPTTKTRRTRLRNAFFFLAAAAIGACLSLIFLATDP